MFYGVMFRLLFRLFRLFRHVLTNNERNADVSIDPESGKQWRRAKVVRDGREP